MITAPNSPSARAKARTAPVSSPGSTSGSVTTHGSVLSRDDAPAMADSLFVARLKAAGCVVVGKTTTPEFAWKGVTDSPLMGATRNPHDPALTPGGSSGGAAAADPDNAISRFQLAAEARVRRAGLAWTILRPHAFFTNVLRWPAVRAGEGVVRAPFADVPIAAIDPGDIGEVATVALTEDGHADQVYDLSGPESLRPADQVEILDDVLGWQLSFEPLSDDEARAELRADMPAEYVDAFFGFYVDGNLDESAVVPTVEKVVGRPPRRFADWVRGRSGLARRR